jgi:hypothetical protein
LCAQCEATRQPPVALKHLCDEFCSGHTLAALPATENAMHCLKDTIPLSCRGAEGCKSPMKIVKSLLSLVLLPVSVAPQ